MLTWSLLAILLGLIFWITRKPQNLPPGKWGLPIIGYIPLYTRNISTVITDLKRKYGDIFTWKLGSQVLVGFCDYNMIKEVFNRPECQGRPYLFTFDVVKYQTNTGLVSSVGDVWAQGRRFALRHLKDFGMGKSSMESVIQYEAISLADHFSKNDGKPIEISWSLNVAVLNVVWKLVANQRYDIHDEEIMKFNAMIRDDIDVIQSRCAILDIFPLLSRILPSVVINRVFGAKSLFENREKLKNFLLNVIKSHVKSFNPDDPQDYIDAYLKEVQAERRDKDTIFKDDYLNLVTTLSDLFGAGSETTSSTIRWLVALMANHPEIQEKVQKEIDSVVPRDRLPSLDDRTQLPYTEAMVHEVMRYSSFVPLGLLHATTQDVQVGQYTLPKGTAIFASTRSCHRNPKYFERPEEFYPGHFLNEEGKLLSKKEGFLPFSLGRRQCLGESLARMELFLFSSCLLQKFEISPPGGGKVPLETDPFQPFLNFIMPYKVVFTKRE